MPMTEYLAEAVLNQLFGDTAYATPATLYLGLGSAGTWAASTAYSAGAYIVGSAFSSTNRHIYKCTTAGTSGTTEPTWSQTAGSTTADNTVVWTECTDLFDAGSITGLELSGGGYARAAVANNTTNWPAAAAGPPAQKQNGAAISYASPTATWAQVVVVLVFDASTGGNLLAWMLTPDAVVAGLNSNPSFAVGAITVTLT
jgi:hypothetical protein